MDIQTVKVQGAGYLVNGALSVPTAPGNRHYQAVQKWIAKGNTPEPEFTQAETDAKAVFDEKEWVAAELRQADIGLAEVQDGHSRKKGSVGAWRKYRNDLRDRVIDGVIQPGQRPKRPK